MTELFKTRAREHSTVVKGQGRQGERKTMSAAWVPHEMDGSPQSRLRDSRYQENFPPQGPYGVPGPSAGADLYRENRHFASVTALHPSRSPSKQPSKSRENLHRFVGLGVGLASVAAEHVLSHPCVVLRRQCQVHNESAWYHLTPFSLFQTIFNIQRHQSVTTLWKGIGSTLIVKGMGIATETVISEVSPLPKEVSRHSSVKKIGQHLLLKCISCLVVTPFYAASLVETVQSEIASERPGVFDCFREGGFRLLSLSAPQTTRLLPMWKLVVPVITYGVVHYVVVSVAQYAVMVSVRANIINKKRHHDDEDTDAAMEKSLYETYYPELIATFTGNFLADTLLYPLETILHRLCLQGTRTIIDNTDTGVDVIPIITRYEGFTDCLNSVLREEGLTGLYKGFGALLLQYGLHMAILKLTKFLFRLLASEEFLSPEASPSKRLIPMEDLPQHQARYDGMPR